MGQGVSLIGLCWVNSGIAAADIRQIYAFVCMVALSQAKYTTEKEVYDILLNH